MTNNNNYNKLCTNVCFFFFSHPFFCRFRLCNSFLVLFEFIVFKQYISHNIQTYLFLLPFKHRSHSLDHPNFIWSSNRFGLDFIHSFKNHNKKKSENRKTKSGNHNHVTRHPTHTLNTLTHEHDLSLVQTKHSTNQKPTSIPFIFQHRMNKRENMTRRNDQIVHKIECNLKESGQNQPQNQRNRHQ